MSIQKVLLFLLSILLASALVAAPVIGAESPLSVILPQKMQEAVKQISKLSAGFNQKLSKGQKSIDKVSRKIRMTSDSEELFELKSRYLNLRKSNVLLVEQKIDGIEGQLATLAMDMQQLDRVWKDSHRYGIGKGLRADDLAAREAVSETMKGIGTLVNMIEQQNPSSDVEQIKHSLLALDETARRFFKGDQQVGLKQQMALIKDWLVLARSVKRLIASEKVYLDGRFIGLQNTHIATSLRKAGPSTWGIEKSLHGYRKGTDKEVFESGSQVDWQPRRRQDLKRLGQGYGS